MKKVISILFLTLLETIVFTLLNDYVFNELLFPPSHNLLNWGISLEIALLEFICLSVILNAFMIFHPDLKPFWPIFASIILYSFTWIDDLAATPLLALKLLASASVGFFSYYLFSLMLSSITRKFTWVGNEN